MLATVRLKGPLKVVPHGGNLSTLCQRALKRKYGTRVGRVVSQLSDTFIVLGTV